VAQCYQQRFKAVSFTLVDSLGGQVGESRYACIMEDSKLVRCPYCREQVSLYVDPDTTGVMVEDCEVCCRPWHVEIERSGGKLRVRVNRAQ